MGTPKRRYEADLFKAWLDGMRDPSGLQWSKSRAAHELGCGRNQIADWAKNGAPYYIGLACQTLWEGKRHWNSPKRINRAEWAKVERAEPRTKEQMKAVRLRRVRWTKAQASV